MQQQQAAIQTAQTKTNAAKLQAAQTKTNAAKLQAAAQNRHSKNNNQIKLKTGL